VDEHGGVSGLITLENVLEELLGEISEKPIWKSPECSRFHDNEWIVPGKSHIDEVNGTIPMNIPDSKEFEPRFPGMFWIKTGRIPKVNEEIPLAIFWLSFRKWMGTA